MFPITVPFKIKNVYEGFAESSGLLIYNQQMVKIQLQTKDTVFGVFKSKVNEYNIPLENIKKIDFNKSIFGNKLTININNMQSQFNIPNQKAGEITVSIEKKNIDSANEFASNVNYDVAEINYINEFNDELNKNYTDENS